MSSGIVAITVPHADEELRQLAAWLGGEDELRDRVRLGALDAVMVAVTSRSAPAFCTSLCRWLGRHPGTTDVSLKIKRSGAVEELELRCGAAPDPRQILTTVRGFLDQD